MQKIFGFHPIIEAIEAGKSIEKVFFKQNLHGKLFSELFSLVKKKAIPYQFVPEQWFNKYRNKNTQGVVALISAIEYVDFEQLIIQSFEQDKYPFFVVLDGITDVRNLGAIARSCVSASVDGLIVKSKNAARINADAIKTSAGALLKLPITRVKSLVKAIEYMKNSGITIVAATEKGASLYFSVDYKRPIAIIMGAEDKGISQSVLNLADYKAKIPILGDIDSLNVSVAAGIFIYEVLRQRFIS